MEGTPVTPINRFHPIGFDRAKLGAEMRRQGLAAILLSSPENVYYTTGYTALPSAGNPILYMLRNRLPFFSLVEADGRVTLLCWDFSAWNMDFGVDEIVGYADLQGALGAVRTIVGDKVKDGKLGVESSCPFNVLSALAPAVPADRLVVADAALDTVRLVKTPTEIACLQKGVDIIEQTCGELYDILRIGMGRNELTHEAKKRLIANGADGISHLTFSFALANPEFDIDEVLEPGKLVTLDLGAIYRGYCSDNRRFAFAGPVPDHIEDLYKRLVGIVDGVGEAMKPGTSYKALMDLARSLYAREKLEPIPRFNHVGHNIGLETEERWLDDDPDSVIEAGMVINIELYSYASTGEQLGNEESYIIEETGPKRISRLPREIRQIG